MTAPWMKQHALIIQHWLLHLRNISPTTHLSIRALTIHNGNTETTIHLNITSLTTHPSNASLTIHNGDAEMTIHPSITALTIRLSHLALTIQFSNTALNIHFSNTALTILLSNTASNTTLIRSKLFSLFCSLIAWFKNLLFLVWKSSDGAGETTIPAINLAWYCMIYGAMVHSRPITGTGVRRRT